MLVLIVDTVLTEYAILLQNQFIKELYNAYLFRSDEMPNLLSQPLDAPSLISACFALLSHLVLKTRKGNIIE